MSASYWILSLAGTLTPLCHFHDVTEMAFVEGVLTVAYLLCTFKPEVCDLGQTKITLLKIAQKWLNSEAANG